MKSNQEEALWARLRSGDKSALREIYDQEYGYLYNYGRKIFGDEELVMDAIHDLFVDIWQRHDSLGPTDHIRRYLGTSMRRRAIADLQKRSKVKNEEAIDQLDFQSELSVEGMMINAEMSAEQAERIRGAYEQLSKRQREIVYLRFYQGLDYEEISEVMDIGYQSLRNTLSKAIKNMRNALTVILLLIFSLTKVTNLI